VGLNLDALKAQDPVANIKSKTHLGAPGNLGLDKARAALKGFAEKLAAEARRVDSVKQALLQG
jgi:hypothetical protein